MTRALLILAGALVFAARAAAPSPAPDDGVERNRDAIARVAVAEAGDQGDSGLAAVIFVILNRLRTGRWGLSVDAVLNAPGQFEPVMRVGGDWRRLRPPTREQQARVDTILNLAMDNRLPDLTKGAIFFQNPKIVEDRARLGLVPASLVNFGGLRPLAVIGAHAFYAAGPRVATPYPTIRPGRPGWTASLFGDPTSRRAEHRRGRPPEAGRQGLFVTAAGDVVVSLGPLSLTVRAPSQGGSGF